MRVMRVVVLVFAALIAVNSAEIRAGVVTVINEQFFESETRALFDDLEKALLEMPDMEMSGRDGRLSWDLTSLGVYQFDGPTTNVEITSNNDRAVFTLELQEATIKTSFDWASRYNAWFTDIGADGSANAKLYGVGMSKSVALGITEEGKLELDARDCGLASCCDLNIREMDISVYGGIIAWILDKTISWWEEDIKDMMRDEACTRLDNAIHAELNAALREFPSTTNILHEDLHLNYTLLHLSTVGDCLVLGVDGGVGLSEKRMGPTVETVGPSEETVGPTLETVVPTLEEVGPTEENLTATGLLGVGGHTPLPASTCVNEDYDFSTRISQSTIQGLLDSVFQSGMLSSYSVPQEIIQRIKMFQPGFFPRGSSELLQHYLLGVDAVITSSPTVTINANRSCIDLDIPVELKLTMLHPNKSKDKKLLLTLNTTYHLSLLVMIRNQVTAEEETAVFVTGSITEASSTLHNVTHNVDYEEELELESSASLLKMIQTTLIRPRLQKFLENGIPTNFGEIFDVSISQFKYHQDYVEFDGQIDHWALPS